VWSWTPLSELCSWETLASSYGRDGAALPCALFASHVAQVWTRYPSTGWSPSSGLNLPSSSFQLRDDHTQLHATSKTTGLNRSLWGSGAWRKLSQYFLEPHRFNTHYCAWWHSRSFLLSPKSSRISISWKTKPQGWLRYTSNKHPCPTRSFLFCPTQKRVGKMRALSGVCTWQVSTFFSGSSS
jgi:hypothetical protein